MQILPGPTAILMALCLTAVRTEAWELGHQRPTWLDPDRGNRAVSVDLYYPALSAGGNATPAPAPAGGFPALVFGHGFLMSADRYGWLATALVPEGRWVALPRTETGFSPDHLAFAQDLAFVARRLGQESADPASPYHTRIGPLVAGGHSMGGGAAVLAVALEPAFDGLLAFAPAETNSSAIQAAPAVDVPALLVTGADDCVTPTPDHGGPMYAALGGGCRFLAEITGASHCQFADPDTYCSLGEIFCPSPGLGRGPQQAATAALAAPWLDALAGAPGAWSAFQAALAVLPGVVQEDCPAPPQQGMGTVTILADPPGARLGWPPSPGAVSYRVEGATPAAVPVFIPLTETPDTTWQADPSHPARWFRVRALYP